MNIFEIVITSGVSISTLIVVLYFLKKMFANKKISNATKDAEIIVKNANKDASRIINRAENEAQNMMRKNRKELDDEIKERHRTVNEIEKRIANKEKHVEGLEEQNKREYQKMKGLQEKQTSLILKLSEDLEKVAELTKEDAEKKLMSNIELECKNRAGRFIKAFEEKTKRIANRRAKEIIIDAIQRTAVDHVTSITTTTINLPDDDMKGRVIGKEGRNIRAFESISGVDVIIDDTPGTVILSAFDPIRREVSKIAMTSLLSDGRIHPARIEEEIQKAREQLNQKIIEHGEKAADELGLEFHPKIIEYMGKLFYRSSYGQNILHHSLEAAHVAGIIANQLGVNTALAKRGTMLHDIGKALDFEREGTHTHLGREICQQYGESPEIINCIMAHHEEEPPETIEAVIVMVADAMSSVRPGARREAIEQYVERLGKLEKIAAEFEGVDKAFAIRAGREIRVMVNPEKVEDDSTHKLAFDIAQKVEREVDYPGEVQIHIIRETRAYSTAK